jgi:hypothetical protein
MRRDTPKPLTVDSIPGIVEFHSGMADAKGDESPSCPRLTETPCGLSRCLSGQRNMWMEFLSLPSQMQFVSTLHATVVVPVPISTAFLLALKLSQALCRAEPRSTKRQAAPTVDTAHVEGGLHGSDLDTPKRRASARKKLNIPDFRTTACKLLILLDGTVQKPWGKMPDNLRKRTSLGPYTRDADPTKRSRSPTEKKLNAFYS